MLRRYLAICFLLLMIFRSVGYIVLVTVWEHRIDMKVRELVETHASEMGGSLIFTTPVEGLSNNESSAYIPMEGKIAFEGVAYRMVKQKTYRAVRYIVCIKDNQSGTLMTQINDVIARAAGQPLKDTNSLLAKISSMMKYCRFSNVTEGRRSNGWRSTINYVVLKTLYSFTLERDLFRPPSVR